MATCNVVNVLCPNGRRQKVKVSPQTTLIQLIEEVCKKQSINSKNCSVRHQRKILDSSITVRFANLPNNAHLELLESAEEQVHTVKKCVVALHLESGVRLVHEFNSDDSLFKILQHWKSQSEGLTFDDDAVGVVCIYANQEVKGLEKLKTTTLSMIGLNGGRGVIRIIQPSSTKVEKDQSVMMEGVFEKPSPPATNVETTTPPTTTSVVVKSSSEDMDVVSRCASSVSMASQGSAEDCAMQCTDSTPESIVPPSASPETSNASRQPDGKLREKSRQNEKTGKRHEVASAMDVEPEVTAGKVAPETEKDLSSLPSGAADTCESAATVQTVEVFGGVGRTLSVTGPHFKKPRFHSPPPCEDKSSSRTQEDTKDQIKDNDNVGQLDRQSVAFRLEEGGFISDDISDDFFELSVSDLRIMLKDLKNERTVEAPLMTQSMREMQEQSKMDKYERVAIRVYFPDRSVLQGFFLPQEKVSAVTHFVRENIQESIANFYLYTTPPRTLLDKPNMTLLEAKLVPTAVIHFGTRETLECYLNSNIVQQMTKLTEANDKVYKSLNSVSPTVPLSNDSAAGSKNEVITKLDNQNKPEAVVSTSTSEPKHPASVDGVENDERNTDESRRNVDKAVPKWFKLGK